VVGVNDDGNVVGLEKDFLDKKLGLVSTSLNTIDKHIRPEFMNNIRSGYSAALFV
jgi:GTPase